jgi:DNA polymerase IV
MFRDRPPTNPPPVPLEATSGTNNSNVSIAIFKDCPPILVLPTHLDLDELHALEENLTQNGATLTYDISEAKIVLAQIRQAKRAALELRSRGLWTEEITPREATLEGPTAKRRRRGRVDELDVKTQVIDLASCGDHGEDEKEKRYNPLSSPLSASFGVTDDASHIKVVKLEWAQLSLRQSVLLPIDFYTVYYARIIPTPAKPPDRMKPDNPTHSVPGLSNASVSTHILRRAMEDASSKPTPLTFTGSRFETRRAQPRPEAPSSQSRTPPKLYRETTSEHDEIIPLPPAPDWVKSNVLYACMRSAPLHPPNERFMEQLIKIRRIRELTLDEIGVRAYSTSIAAIAAYPYEFRSPKEVLALPGCDVKIANLFVEFKNSSDGTLEAARALEEDPALSTLYQFYNIWGVGAKTAREFYYHKGWRDLDDIIEYGWNNLSRVQQIGLKYYDEFADGIPRQEVVAIAKTVLLHAKLVRPESVYDGKGLECITVGGYRRGKEVCGDIDLILSHRDERVTKDLVLDIVRSLETEGWVTHTLALHMTNTHRDQQTLPFRGEIRRQHRFDSLDKALVVWQDPNFDQQSDTGGETGGEVNLSDTSSNRKVKNPNPHRRVDIIISPWRTLGCAVLGWSGDTTFERDLRRYAKKAHGWKFDSSGIRERTSGGQVIDLEGKGNTWEERERLVMEGLGIGWRPAVERCTR